MVRRTKEVTQQYELFRIETDRKSLFIHKVSNPNKRYRHVKIIGRNGIIMSVLRKGIPVKVVKIIIRG